MYLLRSAMQQMQMSARAFHRILKLARTIADLADCEKIETADLAEAIRYRPQGWRKVSATMGGAVNLWKSKRCDEWQAAWDKYSEVIRAQQVRGLEELDAWYREDLPKVIAARKPAYITRGELERVTTWKMKRGVWRERNRLLVAGNSPALVKRTAKQAFATSPDANKPIAILSALAGVGPATASAVLAAFSPDLFPFFDELVAQQIPTLGPVAFTGPYYRRYAAALRECAAELNEICMERTWTAQATSQALWAASGGKIAHAGDKSVG